ncbi:MAG TPA: ribosome maturation factor RimM [Ktedonobacterales bacterium]
MAVGEVVGVFGLRGELKVRPLTDFPERFATTKTIYAGADLVAYAVRSARVHKEQVILGLEGIGDPDAAETLRGKTLYIPASELMPLAEGQFYLHDLRGLAVRHVNGTELGIVTDVLTGGGNDLLVIRRAGKPEVLFPFVKEYVRSVDLASRILVVDPIPGFFDDAAEEAL